MSSVRKCLTNNILIWIIIKGHYTTMPIIITIFVKINVYVHLLQRGSKIICVYVLIYCTLQSFCHLYLVQMSFKIYIELNYNFQQNKY